MKTYFPSELKPAPGEQPADRRAKRRLLRKAMRQEARTLITRNDYTIGDSLKIPRAAAFQAAHNGKPVKIGIRSSADRWLALTQPALAAGGELTEVDEIFVITFADAKKRDVIQLWRFEAAIVAGMANKVFAASGKTGQQWLPLDDTQDADVHSMVAGSLSKHGTMLVEQPVQWVDDMPVPSAQSGASTGAPAAGSGMELRLTIAQAKRGLAAHFGVEPDSIKITIEG